MTRPPGWQRTQAGWTDEPCTARQDIGVQAFICQKKVPTRNGVAHSHRDHWWEGVINGRPTRVGWEE